MKIVHRGKARVPERTSLHSFNLLWLMWAVCGGFFITNFLLSNWLTILIKPEFEDPVDTAQDQQQCLMMFRIEREYSAQIRSDKAPYHCT